MNKKTVIFGLALVLIGLFLLGRTFDLIWFSFGDLIRLLIPFGLIALGVWLIVRKKHQEDRIRAEMSISGLQSRAAGTFSDHARASRAPDAGAFTDEQATTAPPKSEADSGAFTSERPYSDGTGKVRYSKFLGDMSIDCDRVCLQNAELSIGIGDVEMKLRGAILSPGLNRLIISGFIGDVRLFIPPELAYTAHCSNFIGDIEIAGRRASGFGNSLESKSPDYDAAERKLYIAANLFIGDIKVYSV